jgi:hypothetical protein
MKRALFLVLAATVASPALAVGPADLLGTWECRVPGAPPTKTPPIVWFGPAQADGTVAATALDLDGFARTVSGISDVVPDAAGWWKVQPQDGPAFRVQPDASHGRTPGMTLRRDGASYHCLRLPYYGV